MEKINGLMIAITAAAVLLLAAASNQFFIEYINSDFLYGFEAAKNLLATQSLAGQNFPAAPYFFPDLLIVLLLSWIASNLAISHFVYSILFLSVYLYVVYQLLRSSGLAKTVSHWGALFALISYFSIIPTGLYFLRDWPLSHQTTLLITLFLLQYYLRYRDHHIHYWAIFIGSFLCFISDKILFVQMMVPLSIILLKDYYDRYISLQDLSRWLGIFLIVFITGAFANEMLAKYFSISFSLDASLYRIRKITLIADTIQHVWQLIKNNILEEKTFYFFISSYVVISCLLLFKIKRSSTLANIILFLIISPIINLILAILAGKITDSGHLRYIETFYMYPSILLALLCMHYWQIHRQIAWVMVVMMMLNLGVFFKYNHDLLKTFSLKPPYNDSVRCMDDLKKRYHLTSGVAEYWSVRSIRMLSKTHISLSQVDWGFHLINLIDHQRYFYADLHKKIPLTYQFIIVNQISKDAIQQAVGRPDDILYCPKLEVWLYQKVDSQKQLNDYLIPQLARLR